MQRIKGALAIVIVFLFSTTAAFSESCSINLMWIKTVKNDAPYIIPEYLPKSPEEKTLDRIKGWHDGNPACELNFWYDHQTVEDSQIKNTQQLFEENGLKNMVKLRDIWTLKTVENNPAIFQEPVPIYFRVDLLRAVVADELARENSASPYIVYADLNIPPIENTKLFDEKTVRLLDKIGLILSKPAQKFPSYENGFFMMNSQNKTMLDTHREVLIQHELQRAMDFLTEYKNPDTNDRWRKDQSDEIKQQVYFRYPLVIMEYAKHIPELAKFHIRMEDVVKDVGQPNSHLSTFDFSGAL